MKTLKNLGLIFGIVAMIAIMGASSKWLWSNRESAILPTVAEINSVDSIKTDRPIQRQLDAKFNIADGVLGYTAAEVDASLATKQTINTYDQYIAPFGPTAFGVATNAGDPCVANTVYACRIYIPFKLTFTKIEISVSTNIAANTSSVAIYSDDKNTKIISAENIDVSTTGKKSTTVASTTLQQGYYWIAYSNSINTIRVNSVVNNGLSTVDLNNTAYGTAANSATAGVMPSTLGAITQSTIKFPIIALRN